jgi:hypothetical protein
MGGTIKIKLSIAGFPRSGNNYLHKLLIKSFPYTEIKEYIGNASALDLKDCIVPVRNPYSSVPSWGIFSDEKNLDAIALWNLRFLSKVLKNIDNLYVVNFLTLTKDTNFVLEEIAKYFIIEKTEIDITRIDINANLFSYKPYNSPVMEDCFIVYKEILKNI